MTVEATLDNTLGATFIGIVISTILFGITVLQSYLYFADGSAGDPIFLKIFVAVMLAIDAFHVALLCHLYYYYTVSNFGNLIALAAAVWSMDIQIGVGVLLSTMVQWFYAWRIYKLSNQKDFISPIAVCVLSTSQFALGIALTVKTYQIKYFADSAGSTNVAIGALSCEVACNILIMVAMVWYLSKNRARSRVRATRTIVLTLITYVVNTGAVTTACAIGSLIAWDKVPFTLIQAPFWFVMVRLYSCSFLSILNTRRRSRGKRSAGTTLDTVELSTISAMVPGTALPTTSFDVEVKANTQTFGSASAESMQGHAGKNRWMTS